jgi:hypothetical protein
MKAGNYSVSGFAQIRIHLTVTKLYSEERSSTIENWPYNMNTKQNFRVPKSWRSTKQSGSIYL